MTDFDVGREAREHWDATRSKSWAAVELDLEERFTRAHSAGKAEGVREERERVARALEARWLGPDGGCLCCGDDWAHEDWGIACPAGTALTPPAEGTE